MNILRADALDVEEAMDLLNERASDRRWDWGISAECAMETAWSAEVRITEHPNNPKGADESRVWYVAGGQTADDAIYTALRAALEATR